MKNSTTSERLKQLMKETGLRQIDILKKISPLCKKYNIKMGSNDLSQYVTGKVEPSQKKLSLLAEALDVSEVWLMGYDVEKNEKVLTGDDYLELPRDFKNFKKGDKIKAGDLVSMIKDLENKHDIAFKKLEYFNKNVNICQCYYIVMYKIIYIYI